MKVLICGMDGYIGWALKGYIEERHYEVVGFDNLSRRRRVKQIGSDSLFPISHSMPVANLTYETLKKYEDVDVVIHLAEQPSAPYSMRGMDEALETQDTNINGTMELLWWLKDNPHIYLIKLGSMGVYGTPNDEIPEYDGAIAYDPGSFYHISKAADSMNLRKACQWWGINATDLHQGVVYGHVKGTRFDYDSYFGTVLNRFMTQAAIGHPLTVYGMGEQTRGYINIKDTLQCIEIAMQNPPVGYRVFNQFTETFMINDIAKIIQDVSGAKIIHTKNPRFEKERHYYHPAHNRLTDLGLEPHYLETEIESYYKEVYKVRDRINPKVIEPQTTWQ